MRAYAAASIGKPMIVAFAPDLVAPFRPQA